MRILFIANSHLNLYKDIEEELLRQGHQVITVEDKMFKTDPFYRMGDFAILKKGLFKVFNPHNSYWKKKIRKDKRLSDHFDMLLVLSGASIGKYLIEYLEKTNPNIRKVLYTWDSCTYYDFNRLTHWFDKCYTFDLLDSKSSAFWKLLPIYYVPSEQLSNVHKEYDLFCIGTNHDGRYSLLKKIIPQLKENGLKYYIKLVEQRTNLSLKSKIKYNIIKRFFSSSNEEFIDEMEFVFHADELNLRSHEIVQRNEYDKRSSMSHCILDSQRENQSGLTARFIWALADKQKIATTNKWVLEYPFINHGQVCVIDKNDPIIPINFMKSSLGEDEVTDVTFLRIDNWVKELLS